MKSSEDGSEHQPCAASRYFTAALQNAPKESFLRQAVGRWFLTYDSAQGELLLRRVFANDSPHTPENPHISQELSQFLYELHLDDLSEREKQRDTFSQQEQALSCDIHVLQQSSGMQEIEIGNDQGVPDWKAPLIEQSERIQKTICLPEDLTAYREAAVKVYMNNGGSPHFSARFYLDDQLIQRFERKIPSFAKWYEIPFDIDLLHGKPSVNIYIRVNDASRRDNFLQIWGSRMSSAADSVLNFDTTDDLSSERGIQTGEYLIRLILRT